MLFLKELDEYSFLYTVFIVHFCTYWIIGGIFTFIENYKFEWINEYKIQKYDNNKDKKFINIIITVLINQTIISYIFVHFLYTIFKNFNFTLKYGEYPNVKTIIYHFFIYFIIEEILFYYSHRMLHHASIYKYIHKKHHYWKTPISITAIYCHPIEHIISNLLPIFIGPFIMESHVILLLLWIFIATANTLNAHSGFNLPFLF